MKNAEINTEIVEIWKDCHEHIKKHKVLAPLFYPEFKKTEKTKILFIGLNPSFNEDFLEKILKKLQLKPKSPKEFFKWDVQGRNIDNFICNCIKVEEEAREEYSLERKTLEKSQQYKYFKALENIANPLEWNHVDLFLCRENDKNNLTDAIELSLKEHKIKEISKFAEKQIELLKDIIQNVQPKVIVVVNALASDIIREKCLITDEKFNECGWHVMNINKNEIPIFFSCIPYYLDRGSRERLKWCIERALKR